MNGKISFGKIALVLSILISLVIVQSTWSQNDDWEQHSNHLSFAPDRILVKFHATTPENVKAAIHQFHGSTVLHVIPELDVHVVQISKNKVREMLRNYYKEGWIEFAEPDYIAFATLTPNDLYFGSQWGMVKINTPGA